MRYSLVQQFPDQPRKCCGYLLPRSGVRK